MGSLSYRYDDLPIGSFRLFTIEDSQPCSTTSCNEIQISLFEASFDDTPAFEAVSYAWGRDLASATIRCNGKELSVTSNVESILHMLSNRNGSSGIFWLDSICINQFDVDEKNVQVPRMRTIYSEAKVVWVWLGKCSYEVTTAMELLADVENTVFFYEESLHDPSEVHNLYNRFREKVADKRGYYDDVDTNFIVDLINLPWFHRTWPIQELVLAQEAVLVYGDILIPWKTFLYVLMELQVHGLTYNYATRSNPASYYDETQCYRTMSSLVHDPEHRPTFAEVLQVARPKLSTNPADKIYGLYGIFESIKTQGLPKVDYNREIRTIYTDMTTATINIDNALDILYQVCLPNLVQDLPSWVPDYSNSAFFRPIRVEDSYASGSSTPCYSFSNHHLCVRGVLIDKVHEVANSTSIAMPSFRRGYNATTEDIESEQRRTGVLELVRTLQAWVKLSTKVQVYPTGKSTLEAFYRIITQNEQPNPIVRHYDPQSKSHDLKEWMYIITANFDGYSDVLRNLHEQVRGIPGYNATLADYERLFGYGMEFESWPDALKIRFILRLFSPSVALLQHDIFLNSYHKTFLTTRDGYMGTSPRWAKPGDAVALIQGLKTPFIVRKAGEYYSLIGPAYIEGIMNGERWNVAETSTMTLV